MCRIIDQNIQKCVVDSLNFQNFPGEHAPGPPRKARASPSQWSRSDHSINHIISQVSRLQLSKSWQVWGRDFGTTLRHDWAIFSSMPLTIEVRRSPEPSARPSAAADSEERQIYTTCLFAESVGLCLCFLPSCTMYKDNAVANVVAEMGRDLVSTTARLSDLSMPLKGEVRRSPEQSARQPIARSGNFVRCAYSRRALDCAYAFSHRARCTKTTLFET